MKEIKSDEIDNKMFDELTDLVKKNNVINPELFSKYEVKCGLRDADGRGVLVGLTKIGDVHSYIIDESEVIPVPGRLMYRGIDIINIVNGFLLDDRFGFEETCYLLLFGALPDKNSLKDFRKLLYRNRELPEGFIRDLILKAPSKDIMNVISRSVLALYSFDNNPDDTSIRNVVTQCIKLIASFPLLAVYGYQALSHYNGNKSLYIHSPKAGLSTAENILHMLRPDSTYTNLEAKLLDLALVLHADHGGGNNSAFVTHVVTSTGTDTYSIIAAALGALKGPRHGGANIKVVQMFEDMKQNVKDWNDDTEIENYLMKILRKEAFDCSGLIYGIGHAVYTISDPRAIILKENVAQLAREKGLENEFNLYTRVERIAPDAIGNVHKVYKDVSANVDFYSGFLLKMLGIPLEMFTPIFAISRIAGWSAHLIEEIINTGKIIRPAYKSIAPRTKYTPIDKR